jgi:hypothetical protein
MTGGYAPFCRSAAQASHLQGRQSKRTFAAARAPY